MTTSVPIILIDDNRAWLETLAEYLRDRGFQVRTAEGGGAGLALVEENGTCLAVVDLHMPGMDGLEVLRRVRQRNCNVAVFLLSSEEDPRLTDRALAEGAKAFLSKTTAPGVLLRELVRALTAASLEVAFVALFSTRGGRLLPAPSRTRGYLPAPGGVGKEQLN